MHDFGELPIFVTVNKICLAFYGYYNIIRKRGRQNRLYCSSLDIMLFYFYSFPELFLRGPLPSNREQAWKRTAHFPSNKYVSFKSLLQYIPKAFKDHLVLWADWKRLREISFLQTLLIVRELSSFGVDFSQNCWRHKERRPVYFDVDGLSDCNQSRWSTHSLDLSI